MSNLSKEEKKAIELLKILSKTKPYIIWGDKNVPYNKANKINTLLNLIEKQQKELDKKDKIINEMGNNIADSSNMYENLVNTEFQHTAEEVIDYFTKKVEGE